MFSPSAWGGSTCFRCQIRAVARRAPPLFATAQIRGRRRRYASNSTTPRPEDVKPAAEIREQDLENEQSLDRSRHSQADENSASSAAEQNLSDRPGVALNDALDSHDGTGARDHILSGIDRNIQQDRGFRDSIELRGAQGESDYKAKDRKDEGNPDQDQVLSFGQPRQQNASYHASSVAKGTCPHCQRFFRAPGQLNDHLRQGCASLKPSRDLKCSKCGEAFGTRKLLHRHVAKRLCSAERGADKSTADKEGQKIEDVLSQAAKEFSRHTASSRRKPTITDDWDRVPRQETVDVNHQASRFDQRLGEHGEMATDPITQENPSGILYNNHQKRAEEDSEDVQLRTLVRNVKARKREHRRGHMMLVEDASKLSVDTLGKAAEVIVLRDKRDQRRKASLKETSSEEPESAGLKVEDLLDEQESVSPDNVIRNIHGLKPKHQIVSQREFKSLFNTLLGGFTTLQLEKYVMWYREQSILETIKDEVFGEDETSSKELTIPEDVLDRKGEYAWMIEQTHWTPDVDGAVKEAHYPLTGYVMKSMPPKQRLVVQLMRECWEVSIQELLDGNGVVEIRVRDLEFKLLTLGNQRWLQKIARIFLKGGGGQQIEVERSSNLVRVTAPRSVAETCVHALDETLQKIKTKTFKLDQVPMQRLDAGILQELGRITNSVVEFGRLKEVVQVSWVDIRDEKAQSTLEDSGDVVFRLLLSAHASARTSNSITVYPDVEDKGRIVNDYSNKEKLLWMDRRREWARLCLPLTPDQPRADTSWPPTTEVLQFKVEPAEEDLALPTSTLQPRLDALHQNARPIGIPGSEQEQPEEQTKAQLSERESESRAVKVTPSGWRPFKIITKAAFGHILHLNEPELAQNIARPPISTSLASWPRAFAPLTPPVAQMELPGWVPYDETKNQESTILMRFVPYSGDAEYSDSSTFYNNRAPPLELRLTATDRTVIAIQSLRAMNKISISDILLPAEHVDVRTIQHEYAELPAATVDSTAGMEPLQDFLRNSRLELGNSKLVTPPRLHSLGLPRWLMAPPPGAAAGAAAAARHLLPHTPEGNELRRTSYVFAGLEVHRALATTYDGWKLVYTSIESGQARGGLRAELSLEAVPGYDVDLRRAKEAINTTFFLRSLYQLARGQKGHVVRRASDEEQVRTTISWVR